MRVNLPPNIVRCMSAADRARYSPELPDDSIGSEAIEQGKFAKWLKTQWEAGALEYFWQRLDRKATGKPGTPDFIVALPEGKTLWIEMKCGTELSPPQAVTLRLLAKLGHTTTVCNSVREAVKFVSLHQTI